MLKRWRQWRERCRKDEWDKIMLAYMVAAFRGDHEAAGRFKRDLERMDKERA